MGRVLASSLAAGALLGLLAGCRGSPLAEPLADSASSGHARADGRVGGDGARVGDGPADGLRDSGRDVRLEAAASDLPPGEAPPACAVQPGAYAGTVDVEATLTSLGLVDSCSGALTLTVTPCPGSTLAGQGGCTFKGPLAPWGDFTLSFEGAIGPAGTITLTAVTLRLHNTTDQGLLLDRLDGTHLGGTIDALTSASGSSYSFKVKGKLAASWQP